MRSENIRLRAVEPSDSNLMMQWENDCDAWIYSDTIAPLSHKQISEYAANYNGDVFGSGQLRLMIQQGTETIGIVDLYNVEAIHAKAMIGIYIAPKFRNRGYASESVELLAQYCFRILNLHQLIALVEEDNQSSLNLFKKCGFDIVAILPDWRRTANSFCNVVMLRKLLVS